MAATTAARREKLRSGLIIAAEAAIEAGGLPALKARDLALEVGCSLGAIYNVFPNLDALALTVNQRTLAALGTFLEEAGAPGPYRPVAELKRRALIYADFALAHPQRWRALFDHAVNAGASPFQRTTMSMDVSRLFEAPLEEILADRNEAHLFAHALLAGIQGIVQLGLEEMPSPAALRGEVERLVDLAALGLAAWESGKPLSHPYQASELDPERA